MEQKQQEQERQAYALPVDTTSGRENNGIEDDDGVYEEEIDDNYDDLWASRAEIDDCKWAK